MFTCTGDLYIAQNITSLNAQNILAVVLNSKQPPNASACDCASLKDHLTRAQRYSIMKF